MAAVEPDHLAAKGKAFWEAVAGGAFTLRPDELRLLEDACREIDLIERLDRSLRRSALLVTGSQGQKVANPLVQEIRQHRAILARLLGALKLPDPAGAAAAANVSSNARAAAIAKWGRRGA